jgi:hypothetical protein
MKSKTNKKSNKRQSRRKSGGVKHTSKHTLERSATEIIDFKLIIADPAQIDSLSEIAETIAPTYVDNDKDTLLDILLTHARAYLNNDDPQIRNKYHQLIKNTIDRMERADSLILITDKTIRDAMYGLAPYGINRTRKTEILNMIFDNFRENGKRVDGLFMRELLEWAKRTSNDTVIRRLFGQGYRIDDKVKQKDIDEQFANESDYNYAKRREQADKYNELVKSLPARQRTLDTVYAFQNATGKYMNPEDVEELYAYSAPAAASPAGP